MYTKNSLKKYEEPAFALVRPEGTVFFQVSGAVMQSMQSTQGSWS